MRNLLKKDIQKVLISRFSIKRQIKRVAKEVSKAYFDKTPLLIGILNGSVPFLTELSLKLSINCEIQYMSTKSYFGGTESTGKVLLNSSLLPDVKNRDVLIVDDIMDSGITLNLIKETLLKNGAKSVKTAVLLNKITKRKVEIEPDFAAFKIPDLFIVGFGLDYKELYRNLPYIALLKPSVLSEQKG